MPELLRTHSLRVAALGVALSALGPAHGLSAEVAWGTTTSAPSGTRAGMFGVAAGGADDVWAVGAFNPGEFPTAVLTRPYAQHWDGKSWTATPVVLDRHYATQSAQLAGTAIVGAQDAWAVGDVDDLGSLAARSLAYRWDGTQWNRVPTPDIAPPDLPDHLRAVVSLASDDAWAAGDTGFPASALLLHWDGTDWTRASAPDIGGLVALALDGSDLWAASGTRVMRRAAGGDWSVLPPLPITKLPAGALVLTGVAVAGARTWAVGTDVVSAGEGDEFLPYAAFWQGTRWEEIAVNKVDQEVTGVAAHGKEALASGVDGTVVRLTAAGDVGQVTPYVPYTDSLAAIAADPAGRWWAVGAIALAPVLIDAPAIGQGGIRVTTNLGDGTVSWFGPAKGSGTADATGHFAIGGLPVGRYRIIVSGDNCTPGIGHARVPEGHVSAVTVDVAC
jgi:hypothetical protein